MINPFSHCVHYYYVFSNTVSIKIDKMTERVKIYFFFFTFEMHHQGYYFLNTYKNISKIIEFTIIWYCGKFVQISFDYYSIF